MRIPKTCQTVLTVLLLSVPILAQASDPEQGHQLFSKHCNRCHQPGKPPMLPMMPDFTHGERLSNRSDAELLQTIRTGKGMMPAFRGTLSDAALLDVIAYLRTLY